MHKHTHILSLSPTHRQIYPPTGLPNIHMSNNVHCLPWQLSLASFLFMHGVRQILIDIRFFYLVELFPHQDVLTLNIKPICMCGLVRRAFTENEYNFSTKKRDSSLVINWGVDCLTTLFNNFRQAIKWKNAKSLLGNMGMAAMGKNIRILESKC